MTRDGSEWVDAAAREVADALEAMVTKGGTPGGAAVIGQVVGEPRGEPIGQRGKGSRAERVVEVGTIGGDGQSRPATVSTRYDVASLTKVVAVWPLIGYAVAARALELDAPIRSYSRNLLAAKDFEPARFPSAEVTTRQILAHTAGLMRRTRLDLYRGSDRTLVESILAEPLDTPPGARHRYGSRGFVLLGLLLPELLGRPLEELARTYVWEPAGMSTAAYGPIGRTGDVAPTERYFEDAPPIVGQAHDENARLLGGVAGHAGVFASPRDLAAYARWLLDPVCPIADWWRESLQAQAIVPPRTPEEGPPSEGGMVGSNLRRGLAWLLAADPDGGGDVAYHDGFTGVSLYLAPGTGRYLALCTNAVERGRPRVGLRTLRERALAAVQSPGVRGKTGPS